MTFKHMLFRHYEQRATTDTVRTAVAENTIVYPYKFFKEIVVVVENGNMQHVHRDINSVIPT
jgi:hypothetical protein